MRARSPTAARDAADDGRGPEGQRGPHQPDARCGGVARPGAPVRIAKGAEIRAVARDHGVAIMENPLARALHAGVDVDEEIPVEH